MPTRRYASLTMFFLGAGLWFGATAAAQSRPPSITAENASTPQQPVSGPPPPLCLLCQFLFARGRARVDIVDRNVAESVAVIFDLRGVVGAIHQIIQVGQPRRRHGRQRNCHLTVVERRGCKQTTDRDATVGDIQMQLIAGPTRLVAFGLLPTAQCRGRSASIPDRSMPGWRSRRRISRGRSSPLLGRPRLRFCFLGFAVFSGFSRASIAVASREMCPTRRSSWVLLMSASCMRPGKALPANSAKARETVASLGIAPRRV